MGESSAQLAAAMRLLDNIVWESLAGPQARFSSGTATARRYARGFSAIIGFADAQNPDFDALVPFCDPDEHFYVGAWTGPDRALREAVAAARETGAKVGLLYLPESSEFRSWYTPQAERLAREHLAGISRELALPVINAREWMDDGLFVDGFHLSRVGAREFTRKLGPAIAAAFPEARR